MIVVLLYMVMGILIGILIKSEIEVRHRKRRIQNRLNYLQSTASKNNIEQYDSMLESIRSLNQSLSDMNNPKKKEVR